jgi:hypothetical protein
MGVLASPGEDGAEVVAHRDLEPAAAFNHRQDGGHTRPSLLAADVDPVLPIMYTCT